ncbi:hypothetical protein CDL15_Pgr010694 [Punica granatum]|uniref:Uncharacterized protein n=1 Tax=Punica granatum TaxID=22663 RepID=A0A218XQ05_PUNGR|nr:hypothetical protein CDL15_Pgr010694 [Punica granatum]
MLGFFGRSWSLRREKEDWAERVTMSDIIASLADARSIESKSRSDAARFAEVKAWLASQFEAVGKEVPESLVLLTEVMDGTAARRPPRSRDKALAALAIEDKKRQYAVAKKYFEDVLHSALSSTD